jgi:glycosyltransferase involved in cell wall biosynthesis
VTPAPERTVAVTAYPLSRDFRDQLETDVGSELTYLSLPQLRRLSLRRAIQTLRGFSGSRFLLPLEDPSSAAILPVLQAAAAIAGASSVDAVDTELRRRRLGTGALVTGVAALAGATGDGVLALARAERDVAALGRLPRAQFEFKDVARVAYVNPNLWLGLKVGGSIAHVAGVVNGLAKVGLEVVLYSAAEPTLVRPDVEFIRLEAPAAFAMPLELNFHRFQRGAVTAVSSSLGAARFVYVRNAVGSYAGPALSRRLRVPLVLEYNGSEVWAARHWGRPLRFERLAQQAEDASLRHAEVVVVVSEVLRDEVVARGVEERRVVFHPNGVDADLYDPRRFDAGDIAALRAQHGIAPDAIVAAFLGTFGQWHGAEVLAAAAAQLIRERGEWAREKKLHFLFVGDGLRMPAVQALVADPSVAAHVTLAGLVPQAEGPRYLAASDLLVSPHVANADGTRFFGSPTKLFEYMATGKGIVASNLDQIGDVLAPAVHVQALPDGAPGDSERRVAVLTTPGDQDELATGIRFLVDAADWRARLGANARARAGAHYTWDHHVAAILETLSTVSDGRG